MHWHETKIESEHLYSAQQVTFCMSFEKTKNKTCAHTKKEKKCNYFLKV